jgi:hypothetical protein
VGRITLGPFLDPPTGTCDGPVREDLVEDQGREHGAAQPQPQVQAGRGVHQLRLARVDAAQQLPRVRRLLPAPARACAGGGERAWGGGRGGGQGCGPVSATPAVECSWPPFCCHPAELHLLVMRSR